MARRRFAGRRHTQSRTRMLAWEANVDTAVNNTAAGVVRTIVLLGSGAVGVAATKRTCYRIVGDIWMEPQADTIGIFHYGIYKAAQDADGTLQLYNPSQQAIVGNDSWMHWGARVIEGNTADAIGKMLRFDIKVKRIIETDEEAIPLGLVCNVAFATVVNLRILSKLTGTT